tara:strand:+ start:870 stop:2021 length:1152 start_codon:yes stop_codon:yes gene_type:complete
MANKDLFKQAIADAKSIREAAIANAKVALEESITPELKELLAQRLQEMEEEVEEEVIAEEEEAIEEVEEVVAEADEEEAEDDSEESEDEADEEEDAEGEEPAGDDEIADSDMTVDDLKDMIRDILSQEMGDMDGEEDGMEDDMEADAEAEDMAAGDMTAADDEEINLEELMAELAEMAKDEEVIAENEIEEGDYGMEEETVDEGFMSMMKKIYNDPEVMGRLITVDGKKMSLKDFLAMAGGATAGSMAGGGQPSSTKTPGSGVSEADLNEALETIQTLQKELNETNLLNAKLLYVNKVFKTNNLNESQKANVIAAFDKAETVKEVKLVFETVSENIPSGNKKEVVREARGFASAAVGKSDKPEVITEANQAVLRMQKLAGIIK